MTTAPQQQADQCPFVIGADGLARLDAAHADAWLGLQRVTRELTRELESSLLNSYGLSLSGLEVLGRLAECEGRRLRLSRLAQDVGLSVSRVSRIVDALHERGLVNREPYPGDTRATDACLTVDGLALARDAQTHHLADVQQLFFDRLSPGDVELLGAVFASLSSRQS